MTAKKLNFKRITLAMLIISLVNLAAGYGREMVVAMVFGTGMVTDSFMASYSLILTLHDLGMGAMLSASIVPVFASLSSDPGDEGSWQRLIGGLALAICAVTVTLALCIHALFPTIIYLLFPGFSNETATLATGIGQSVVVLIPLQALMVLFMLTLNSRHNYILPSLAYLIINSTFCIIVFFFHGQMHYNVLPLALILGTALATLMTGTAIFRLGAFRTFTFSPHALRPLWKPSRVMLFSLGLGNSVGLLMASHLILRHYASYMGEGALSALGFAFRIYEVPLNILAATAATMVLPVFSKMHIARNKELMAHSCRQILTWGWIVLLPIGAVTFLYSETIVALLLQRGQFTTSSTLLTASALRGFALAIIFEAGFIIFFRIFYAMHRPIMPVYAGILTIGVLLFLLQLAPPNDLLDTALCLSLAFGFTFLFMLINACRALGAHILPKAGIWVMPLAVSAGLAVLWRNCLPEPPSFLMAIATAFLYVACYGLCLAVLMPRQRRQLRQLLSRAEHAQPV